MGKKLYAAGLSIGVNLALAASKLVAASITGSIGLYAESAHSIFDLIASLLAYFGIRKAQEPSDHTHHFGHEKFENLSSLLQALLITGTAFVVIFEAYQRIGGTGAIEFSEAGIALMLVSIPVTYFTSKYLGRIAKQEGSSALEADSAHFTTDVIGSVAVLAGLVAVRLGFPIGDPFAAIIVALVMLYISLELLWQSARVLMDFSPDQHVMESIQNVLDAEKRITRYHKLRARIAGSKILVDLHIHLPHKTSIINAHKISHEIQNSIKSAVPQVREVMIHIEPD